MSNGQPSPADRRTSAEDRGTCTIRITSSGDERSFRSESGLGRLTAEIDGKRPAGSGFGWELVEEADGGTARIESRLDLSTAIFPRRPNLAKVRASVRFVGGELCSKEALISVPQYYRVRYDHGDHPWPILFDDLAFLGLRVLPERPYDALPQGQVAVNYDVQNAVVNRMLGVARYLLRSVNVRITEDDPSPLVEIAPGISENYTEIWIGGRHPSEIGSTRLPDETRNRNLPDVGNLDPSQQIRIYTSQARRRSGVPQIAGPVWAAIFDGLAVVDDEGNFLGGTPIASEDFPQVPIKTRHRQVRAAVEAFGRVFGHVIAHECAHALGLSHNELPINEIMDGGEHDTFEKVTGITDYDPATGRLFTRADAGVGFGRDNLRYFRSILPILR